MTTIDVIMSDLDQYVSSCGNGSYMPENFEYKKGEVTLKADPIFGCHQVREELRQFGEILLQQPWYSHGIGVEIGLGFYGSTHMFWRKFLDKIISIECDRVRIQSFREHTHRVYNQWILDEKSFFISNSSHSSQAVGKLYNFTNSIDFLFIDGDHTYPGVLTDWLLYAPLVKKGGIIAFHDSCCKELGVLDFLNDLQSGRFGETPHVEHIQHSKSTGISYYFKP